ncbi:hypothetical protein LCI18_002224 [Fusarium solani-melongenae]|uniref:Uncharacterized protein n=1 Tax=Fusarium solani subsp. cucurbitae TaxID=2747967 RepID=A0ACD3YQP5_FUSSC|nr:hypothetical protein LCI18_002224 [Fusarium solani-melongenae]
MSNDNQPQPDWSKVPLSDQFIWTDATSKSGRPFKIGTPKDATTSTANATPADNFLIASDKTPFDIQVKWPGRPPPPGFARWETPTAQETATTSITAWQLNKWLLNYNEFLFTCTKSYNFQFYDKTGDSYGNNVLWPRSGTIHSIWYFSSDPDIVRVTGK